MRHQSSPRSPYSTGTGRQAWHWTKLQPRRRPCGSDWTRTTGRLRICSPTVARPSSAGSRLSSALGTHSGEAGRLLSTLLPCSPVDHATHRVRTRLDPPFHDNSSPTEPANRPRFRRKDQGFSTPHLPGQEVCLVGEWRSGGERKYYLSNLSPRTSMRRLAATIKARWVCEQAHQQLKQEPGLDDFVGRSWTGLHRHALVTCIAFAHLQHLQLQAAARGEKVAAQRSSAQTNTASCHQRPAVLPTNIATTMSALPQAPAPRQAPLHNQKFSR